MPKPKKLNYDLGDRVRMKEAPCSSCPPFTQKCAKKGSEGVVMRMPVGAVRDLYATRVKWDSEPIHTDVCPRHLEKA